MPFFSPMQQKSQAARHGQAGSEEGAAAPPLPPPPPPAAQPTLSDGPEPSLRGEWWNMWLLLTLYFLQGIPIGLASSIPLLLLSRGASYADQALYSFSSYPYSLKWLWAPVVDALHTQRWGLGKRKSWVVPCQLATGAVMMVVAAHVDRLLPSEGAVDVPGLLAAFLVLYFLVATQDIAVDGWALELLRPENVGYASTANTVGQGVGIQAAFSIFLAMDSADVCNTYIRPALGLPPSSAGMVTLGGFLWAWGAVFLVVTLAVWALKHEAPEAAAAAAAAEALPAPAPARRSSSRSSRSSSSSSNSGSSSSAGAAAVEEGECSDAEETEALVQGGAAGLRERKKSNSRSGSEEGKSRAREAVAAPASSASASASSDGEAQRKAPAAPVAAPTPPPAVPASSLAALHASYQDFFSTCFLPNIFSLAVVLLTFKAGFAAVDATTTFVLQERGVPKETLAFIDTISFPLQLAIQVSALQRCKLPAATASRAATHRAPTLAACRSCPPPPRRSSLSPRGQPAQSRWTFLCGPSRCARPLGWGSWPWCTCCCPTARWSRGAPPPCPRTPWR
jgi:hypothetical protein